MRHTKKCISLALIIVVLVGLFPISGFAASSEIWPGYPGTDELPAIKTIPDPFKFFDINKDPTGDGFVSSPEEWNARREEIKDLVQRYWLGYRWPTEAEDVVGGPRIVTEPNVISLFGSTSSAPDEFDRLVNLLLQGTVEVRELITNGFFQTPGAVKYTFGPAANETEAINLAIQAWNAGYYISYSVFGFTFYAVLKNSTGELTEPPGEYKQVKYNNVKITNPDTGVEADFNISIQMPTVTQAVYAWKDYRPSVADAVYWDDTDLQIPVVIDIGGAMGSHVDTLKEQGYAYISFTPTDIYPDDSTASDGIARDGVYTELYPYNKDEYEYASGALMAWGWSVSQIISAMEQPMADSEQTYGEYLHIDPTKTLVTGHSRYGKAAMFAAAFDDRISICIPSEPGGSGIQSYRYKVEGKIFNFNTYAKADRVFGKTEIPTVSYGSGNSWFPETAANFVNKDNQLPFDSSDIIALVAPRSFLTLTGIDAHWLGNEGGVAAVQAASEVYAYIGNNDLEKYNVAVRARQSDHVLYKRDVPFIIAIMDRDFKQGIDVGLYVKDLYPTGTGLGNMSYPAKEYYHVGEFNSYPFEINSSYLPWSRPDKYTLWTAQENFLVGYPVSIIAHSNAPDVKLYLPNGTEISAAKKSGDEYTFKLTADQAVYGRYELRTNGSDKGNRSVFFAAVSLADSLRHATSKGDEGEENRLIGFSSRLANTAENPPEVYIDGNITTMSFTPERFKTEETTLLEYGILFHDPLFIRIANEGWDDSKTFHIKNLNFVTIPEFTFEISFGSIKASAANNGKDQAAAFTQPISWNVERYNNGPAEVWPEIPDTIAEREILNAGGTVTRPEGPAPKATNFNTNIVSTVVEHVYDQANMTITFDEELDTREFGFGLDVADEWETTWSDDGKQVTLSVDYDKFPVNSNANLIIFRLKDTEGNIIPGPMYLTLSYPDDVLVDAAVAAINGTYRIPQNVLTRTAWVQEAVNARIPKGNGSTATVTFDNGFKVVVSKGEISREAIIVVEEYIPSPSDDSDSGSSGSSTPPVATPTAAPAAQDNSVKMWPQIRGTAGTVTLTATQAKDMLEKGTEVKIPEIAGLNTYNISIPVDAMTNGKGDADLTVGTKFGTITVADDMLAGVPDVSGNEAVISITQGSKTGLPEEVKAALGNRPIIQLTLSVDGKQVDWDNPDSPVTVTIPYKPTEDELKNPENIVVWYIDGKGNVITVPNGRYDAETGTVTFRTTHFSLYSVAYVQKAFIDLGSVDWAIKAIEALTAKEIMKADGDTFKPTENVTRADFLYALVRALDLNAKVSSNFDDISADAYYYKEIAIAKDLGITLGTGNNKFEPDLSITRQDMMTLVGRTLELLGKLELKAPDTVLDKFTDKSEISAYAVSSVSVLVNEELIVGSNNKVMPKDTTSRAEAAQFVYRLYEKFR